MVQVTYRPQFITEDFFASGDTQECRIVAVYEAEGNNGRKDLQMELVSKTHHQKMSLWGENLRWMIATYGNDTDKWLTQPVKLQNRVTNGKRLKVLSL